MFAAFVQRDGNFSQSARFPAQAVARFLLTARSRAFSGKTVVGIGVVLRHMSTELLFLLLLVGLVVANVALEFIARWRNPPIGEFLDVNNVRLHFIMRGDPDAPPLVMFHGNGTMLQDFAISGLVDKAASKFRVICFDRPGFGHSSRPRSVIWSPERQADLFAAALARLGIERTLVLGHSWGTLVALALAARNSELVKGLVLASGPPADRRCPALHHFSHFELAGPSAFREKTFAPKTVP